MSEDIKTMSSDIGKSTEAEAKVIEGDKTIINGKVYEWKNGSWMPVKRESKQTTN